MNLAFCKVSSVNESELSLLNSKVQSSFLSCDIFHCQA